MIKKVILKRAFTDKKKEENNKAVTKIAENLTTPILTIWSTTITKPHNYKNGQSRYGIVCILDEEIEADAIFMQSLEKLAVLHKVETLGTQGKDDKIYVKFAGKDKINTFMQDPDTGEKSEIHIEDEFPEGIKAIINYDVNLYFNVKLEKWLFNLLPRDFIFYPDENSNKLLEVVGEYGKSKNPRGRPRTKNRGTCET